MRSLATYPATLRQLAGPRRSCLSARAQCKKRLACLMAFRALRRTSLACLESGRKCVKTTRARHMSFLACDKATPPCLMSFLACHNATPECLLSFRLAITMPQVFSGLLQGNAGCPRPYPRRLRRIAASSVFSRARPSADPRHDERDEGGLEIRHVRQNIGGSTPGCIGCRQRQGEPAFRSMNGMLRNSFEG
jgi:hypothetical protein